MNQTKAYCRLALDVANNGDKEVALDHLAMGAMTYSSKLYRILDEAPAEDFPMITAHMEIIAAKLREMLGENGNAMADILKKNADAALTRQEDKWRERARQELFQRYGWDNELPKDHPSNAEAAESFKKTFAMDIETALSKEDPLRIVEKCMENYMREEREMSDQLRWYIASMNALNDAEDGLTEAAPETEDDEWVPQGLA